ncbi:TPA: hypothetical protein ACH3X1_015448 [Trebouxia sp. C0004]
MSSSAPVGSSLSPCTNPARPPPPPCETAPPHMHPLSHPLFPADVVPVLDGSDTTRTLSDHTCVHEISAANSALGPDASLTVNPLFTPRGPSPECPSGDALEAHPVQPMLRDPPSVHQTLMGITPDNSQTLTDNPLGTRGTLLEGNQIPRIDPSVFPAAMDVPVDSQTPKRVALEAFQAPLQCSLDPQAARSTQAGECLTPVDSPWGGLANIFGHLSRQPGPMITQSGTLLTPAGGPLCNVEFPMDGCSGAPPELDGGPCRALRPLSLTPQTPSTHPPIPLLWPSSLHWVLSRLLILMRPLLCMST